MKKVLNLISAIIITSNLTIISIACNPNSNRNINHKYHQMYVLGDSLSDAGALMNAVSQVLSTPKVSAFVPAQKLEFSQVYYQKKQFSDGPNAMQILAEKLGLTMNPAWYLNLKLSGLYSFANGTYAQTGTNYAVGGSQAGTQTGDDIGTQILNGFALDKQLTALTKQHGPLKTDDLVVIETGNNDLINALALNNDDASNFSDDQKTIVDNAITSQKNVIASLAKNNAHHILIANAPSLWKTPRFLNNKTMIAQKLTNYYNQQWDIMLQNAQTKHVGLIKKLDLKNLFETKLETAKAQGYDVTNATVAADISGTGIQNAILNNNGVIDVKFINNKTQADLKKTFFLDEVHPTKWLHSEVAQEMYDEVMNW